MDLGFPRFPLVPLAGTLDIPSDKTNTMKNLKTLLLFLGISISFSTSQAQFQICNSSTNQDLHDVYFVDANLGIAVGDSGVIVRSTDGGLNWVTIMSEDTVSFRKVRFFDGFNGMAIGSDLYKTSDAGLTWVPVASLNTDHFDIAVLDSTTCLVTGYPNSLLRSTDKGATFGILMGPTSPSYEYGLLSFVDENIGYACGYGGGDTRITRKTIDGGVSWVVVMDSANGGNPTVMEAMYFVSENTGFKGGWYNAHLQKTVDGANHWDWVTYQDSTQYLQILDFHIEANQPGAYYASGWYGELSKSTDGGDTWFNLNSGLSNTTSLYGIFFLDEETGWAVGSYGSIIKTTTGGVILGMEEVVSDLASRITISPNPSTDIIHLSYPNDLEVISIRVIDAHGRNLRSGSSGEKAIDLTGLSAGIYFIELVTDQGRWVRQVVKN